MRILSCTVFTRMIKYCVILLFVIHQTRSTESQEQSECHRLSSHPCCYNQYLDKASNTCTDCTHGSYGWNCKSSCPSGFYGRLCRSPCECVAWKCNNVTGCITTDDSHSTSSTITKTRVTSQTDLLQLSTVASATGGVSTITPTEVDLHIYAEDDNDFPILTMGFSLLGSFSSICIIGCILFIRSRKKKMKFRSTPDLLRIRQVLLPCVYEDHDRQRDMIQGSGDIELSNVNRAPACGQEEDDSLYSEIRYSQFIGGASTRGACMDTVACSMHKCNPDKPPDTSEMQKIYQMTMDKNEYDHVNLKIKSLDMLSKRNLSETSSNNEEYVSNLKNQSHCNKVRPNDDLKCTSLTLPTRRTSDFNEMGQSESKNRRLLTGYSLQRIEFEKEVEVDQPSGTAKHLYVGVDGQIGPSDDLRPYSMAGGLSENDLCETVEVSSNLPKINISENRQLSENDLSEKGEDTVNLQDNDTPEKREN